MILLRIPMCINPGVNLNAIAKLSCTRIPDYCSIRLECSSGVTCIHGAVGFFLGGVDNNNFP